LLSHREQGEGRQSTPGPVPSDASPVRRPARARDNQREGDMSDTVIAALISASVGLGGLVVVLVQGLISRKDRLKASEQAAAERDRARRDADAERERAAEERDRAQREAEAERERARRDAYLFQAFRYFTGHTQPRNVGISIIEGFWQEAPDLRGVYIPLLVNQAVYLLAGSKQRKAPHERNNLDRMMELLTDPGSPRARFPEHYKTLAKTVKAKKEGQVAGGVEVDADTLDRWLERLGTPSPAGGA
jgi:hypothetical protein